MTKPQSALPAEVQEQLTRIAFDFAQEIVSILQGSVGELAGRLGAPEAPAAAKRAGSRSPAARKTARPAPKPAKAPKAAKAPKPAPASDGLDKRVIAQLKKSPSGLGVEQLNRALGTSTPQLGPVLQSLVDRGRLTKSGQARGTKYHAV